MESDYLTVEGLSCHRPGSLRMNEVIGISGRRLVPQHILPDPEGSGKFLGSKLFPNQEGEVLYKTF